MKIKKKILILGDDRVGTYSQAVTLAKESGLEFEILYLKYNFLKFIPNIFFSQSIVRLKTASRQKIKELNYCPQYIISAGRRPAPIAIFLKNYFKKNYGLEAKLIQIMRPEIKLQKFDFVILPKHDKIKFNKSKNLITTIGALSKINIDENSKIYQNFNNEFKKLKKPIITLLIGGDTKNKKLTPKWINYLITESIILQKRIDATLVIMNSRRTSKEANLSIKKFVSPDIIFYNYYDLIENPYHNILNLSDYFIITGDSVSMITECCSTGKQVYIFSHQDFCTTKHQIFHDILIKNNYAKILKNNIDFDIDFKPQKLNEIGRIAKLIF